MEAELTERRKASGWGRGPGIQVSSPSGSSGGLARHHLDGACCSTAWMWWTHPLFLGTGAQNTIDMNSLFFVFKDSSRPDWSVKSDKSRISCSQGTHFMCVFTGALNSLVKQFYLFGSELFLQGFSNLSLIAIDGCTVNVAIPSFQCPNNCLFHLLEINIQVSVSTHTRS